MWITDYDIETVNEIQKCREKIKIEENKKRDIDFNIKVYTEHMLSQIHSMHTPFSIKCLECLWREFNKKNDEEKDEKFKDYYKYLNDTIIEDIIGDTECKYKKTKIITGIIVEGYSTYCYNISFMVNNTEFCLYIPVHKNIQEDTLIYANYGMYCLSYKKGCCSHIFTQSYELVDLRKAFKECIENKKYEE